MRPRLLCLLPILILASNGYCQPFFPEHFVKLGSDQIAGLPDAGLFGTSVAMIGDLDGDGFDDIAVGSRDDGGVYNGGLRIIFLDGKNNIKSFVKVPSLGPPGTVFGYSVCSIGDLDGDGVDDLAVGAPYDGDGGHQYGAVYILFMNTDGTVKSSQKISSLQGGFTGTLTTLSTFGSAIANLGDLDNDGNIDIAVGAYRDNGGSQKTGSVYVLFLNSNGTAKHTTKISGNMGGLTATLSFEGYFGVSLAGVGDLDNDGIADLAVGSHRWDAGAMDAGSLWILFMNANGTVKSYYRIDNSSGDIPEVIGSANLFGSSVAYANDIDGDGVGDILVGALGDADQGENSGAIWVLLMNEDGSVANAYKVNGVNGDTNIDLNEGDYFGTSLAYLGMKDGLLNLAIGAIRADDGGMDRGVVWIPGVVVCPDLEADAGPDIVQCNGSAGVGLNAVPADIGIGHWSVLQGEGFIEDPQNPQSAVSNLAPGEHVFTWTISLSACPEKVDTVRIFSEHPPFAGTDTVLCHGRTVQLKALDPGLGIGFWEAVQGQATFTDVNNPKTQASLHTDNVRLRWSVQPRYCPADFDEMDIRVWEIDKDKFYNVITPGDYANMNEVWVVEDLDDLPGQKRLKVFNRWGNLVFAVDDYQNDWNAAGLSAGEYYYHMSLPACERDVKGWIHVIK